MHYLLRLTILHLIKYSTMVNCEHCGSNVYRIGCQSPFSTISLSFCNGKIAVPKAHEHYVGDERKRTQLENILHFVQFIHIEMEFDRD